MIQSKWKLSSLKDNLRRKLIHQDLFDFYYLVFSCLNNSFFSKNRNQSTVEFHHEIIGATNNDNTLETDCGSEENSSMIGNESDKQKNKSNYLPVLC